MSCPQAELREADTTHSSCPTSTVNGPRTATYTCLSAAVPSSHALHACTASLYCMPLYCLLTSWVPPPCCQAGASHRWTAGHHGGRCCSCGARGGQRVCALTHHQDPAAGLREAGGGGGRELVSLTCRQTHTSSGEDDVQQVAASTQYAGALAGKGGVGVS